jgi:hypothetical protein
MQMAHVSSRQDPGLAAQAAHHSTLTGMKHSYAAQHAAVADVDVDAAAAAVADVDAGMLLLLLLMPVVLIYIQTGCVVSYIQCS